MLPIWKDFRAAARGLLRSPYFSLVVIVTLALGIGFNVAVFSIVDAVLLRPLPYDQPHQIVQIWGSTPAKNVPFHNVTYNDVLEWRRLSQSFVSITAGRPTGLTYQPAGSGQAGASGSEALPEQIYGWQVDAEYFPTMGIRFLMGRGFTPEEDQPGADPVAILSHGLWRSRFNADPQILGRAVLLNRKAHTVVGVLPQGFEFIGRRVEAFVPLAAPQARGPEANAISSTVFARLRPDRSLEAAQGEMTAVGRQMKADNPTTQGSEPKLWRIRDWVVRDVKPYLILLSIAALLVIVIACVNVANLMLVRANGRRRETALRSTLGAGRIHLVGQGIAESLLLALGGGMAGVGLAVFLVKWCLRLTPEAFTLTQSSAIDGTALAYSLLLALLTGAVCGAVPAFVATRPGGLASALREGERGASESGTNNRFRAVLVGAEIALSLLLLVGAGLLIQSLRNLNAQGPGFQPGGILTARLTPPEGANLAERRTFYDEVLRSLKESPQVESAAISTILPLTASNSGTGFIVEGRPFPGPGEAPIAWVRTISPDYFDALRIPLKSGRLLREADNSQAPPVAVVNETLAKRFWPNETAVGKRFTTSVPRDRAPTWITVVGVAGDVRHNGVHREAEPELFWSYRQPPVASAALLVRARGDAASVAPVLRKAVATANRGVPLAQVRTLQSIVDDSMAFRRITVWVSTLFATVALLLAGIGVFGMVSYSVSRRRREMGVRLAMGAQPSDVVSLVVRQTVRLAAAGILAGLGFALIGADALRSLLFAVEPRDPAVIVLAATVLLSISLLASWLPARVASRVNPMLVLRSE